jgi:hypothetical protein
VLIGTRRAAALVASGLDGKTCLETIRWFARLGHGIVVAMLEDWDERQRQEALEAGASHFCSKPEFLVAQLRHELAARLEGALPEPTAAGREKLGPEVGGLPIRLQGLAAKATSRAAPKPWSDTADGTGASSMVRAGVGRRPGSPLLIPGGAHHHASAMTRTITKASPAKSHGERLLSHANALAPHQRLPGNRYLRNPRPAIGPRPENCPGARSLTQPSN